MSAVDRTAPRANLGAIFRAGAIAAVVAGVINAVVARIGAALFDVPDTFQPLQAPLVFAFTVFAVLAGTAIYALLVRSGRAADRLFPRIAWGFAVLSLLQPVSLLLTDNPQVEAEAPATVASAVILGVLHLIPAAVIVGLLTRTGRASAL